MSGNVPDKFIYTSLDEERLDEIEKAFEVFPLSLLQDFITFLSQCERFHISRDEAVEYIRHAQVHRLADLQRESMESVKLLSSKSPHCPICGLVMKLEPINNRKDRMVDEHSKSWWICGDTLCPSDPILNSRTDLEILTELGALVHKKNKTTKGV